MNTAQFIQEEETSIKKYPTLVRRVSDMFKDGTYSGPPTLFSQKIRHCCQNLNLLPYLLYSLEHSKSSPLAKRVNICFDHLLKKFVERLLFLYSNVRRVALTAAQQKSQFSSKRQPIERKDTVSTVSDTKARLCTFQKQKPKPTPVLLVIAIYLAPLVLAFQLVGLGSLLIFGKYTPGFIFLITSLFLLGFISMKVMFHETLAASKAMRVKREERRQKRKSE